MCKEGKESPKQMLVECEKSGERRSEKKLLKEKGEVKENWR